MKKNISFNDISLWMFLLSPCVFAMDTFMFFRNVMCLLMLPFVLHTALKLPEEQMVIRKAFFWIFAGWLAISVIATFAAQNVWVALVRTSEWMCYLSFAWALRQRWKQWPQRISWDVLFLISGFLVGILRMAWIYVQIDDPRSDRWTYLLPGFHHIRHISLFAALLLPYVYAELIHRRPMASILRFCLASVVWMAIIWAGGRGACIVSVFSLGLLLFLNKEAEKRKQLFLLILGTLVAGVFLSDMTAPHQFGLSRILNPNQILNSTETTLDVYSSGRLEIWAYFFNLLLESPWLGIGPDHFQFHSHTVQMLFQPHNIFLQFALEWGIVGACAGLTLLFGFIFFVYKSFRWTASPSSIAIAALSSLTGALLYGITDEPFYTPQGLLCCFFSMAVLWTSYESIQSSRVFTLKIRPFIFGCILFSMILQGLSLTQNRILRWTVPNPDSLQAQFVKHMTFETVGMRTWIWAWKDNDMATAMEWTDMAIRFGHIKWYFTAIKAALYSISGDQEKAKATALDAYEITPAWMMKKLKDMVGPLLPASNSDNQDTAPHAP
jgi:O-antigen ligase